ncbi:hypothetical protein ACFY2R_22875 [Micromonospora olivasterospora]|uniref:hypothetical protein n=1 Tax=Micromonospora olivasterospora TaxID=1880 RepID=UPI0036B0C305
MEHPRAVAKMLAEHADHAVMAGLLHDVVDEARWPGIRPPTEGVGVTAVCGLTLARQTWRS